MIPSRGVCIRVRGMWGVPRRYLGTVDNSNANDAKTVVLLFAWLGAHDRYISKYVDMYESISNNVSVLVFKTSISETARARAGEKRSLESLHRIVNWFHGEEDEKKNIILHCFSQSGFMALGSLFYMHQELENMLLHKKQLMPPLEASTTVIDMNRRYDEEELEEFLDDWKHVTKDIKGIIIDSGPSLACPTVWAKGITSTLTGLDASNIEHQHPFMLSMAQMLSKKYFESPEVLKRLRKIREAWSLHVPPVPRLYMYSKNDALIPSNQIESFIRSERQSGIKNQSIYCSPSAAHCALLKDHPEVYATKVKQFVDNTSMGKSLG